MKDGCDVGHRHRYVKIDTSTRTGRAVLRVLRTVVATTTDRERAANSRYAWGWLTYEPPGWDFVAYEYVLTVVGVLHGWFGVTLVIGDGEDPVTVGSR